MIRGVIISVVILFGLNAHAAELGGYAAVDARYFPFDPKFPGQENNNHPSAVVEPEVYHVSEDEKHVLTFRPFARIDYDDKERTHADIRQADYLYAGDDWELRAGLGSVFWGVTESQHLVDIINQDDSIEDTDAEDKLGQPMIQLATMQDWGTLRVYYLPYFRERNFPGTSGRLRTAVPVSTGITRYESSSKEYHPDFAARYTKVFGDFDIGLSNFHGTSREPVIEVSGTQIRPYYEIINQTGMDLQYTTDAWLWKFEGISRFGHDADNHFFAGTGGFEYTFFQAFGTDGDLGLLAEYHYDGRKAGTPGTFFNNDMFVGSRFVFNDVDDTEVLAGAVVDVEDLQTFVNLEASTRLADHWKAEFDARMNTGIDANDPEAFLRSDDFMQLRLGYYF